MINCKRKILSDCLLGAICGLAAFLSLGVLAAIVFDLLRMGMSQITPGFFTGGVEAAGRAGGISPILKSTGWILLTCLVVAIPPGLGAAFWITEIAPRQSRLARWLLKSLDWLASIPSIVFGLFGMAFFCHFLGLGYSILAGGLMLACMILPVLTRTTLSAVEALPGEVRAAGTALGLRKITLLRRVILPRVLPGIFAGVIIGIARALSETAALIFTSGYSTRSPESLMDSGRALSVHIYDLAMNIPGGSGKAAASALVLFFALLVINFLAHYFSEQWLKRLK